VRGGAALTIPSPAGPLDPAVIVLVFGLMLASIGLCALILTNAGSAAGHLRSAAKLTTTTAQPDGATNPASENGERALIESRARPPDPNAGRYWNLAAERDDSSKQIFALLNDYYAANVFQGNTIFWSTLLSMVIGFAFIVYGISKAGADNAVAIVAGVAGVLTQFIGATFLVALRSTQQQSTTYAQTLVELRVRDIRAAADLQATALGLQLLREISDDGAEALANQTRASIAAGLIVQQSTSAPAAPAAPTILDVDDAPRADRRTATAGRVETVASDDTARPPAPRDQLTRN
jgi:hypothetical protein